MPPRNYVVTAAAIDDLLLDLNEPEVFETGDPDNTLVLRRRGFAQLCGLLAEHGVAEPEQLSVFQFQSRVDFVTAKIKRMVG